MPSKWEFGHSGIFVKNFDKTLQYYKSLGLAPELGLTKNPFTAADKTETAVFGKVQPPGDPSKPYFLALLYIGDLELEVLHAPAERPTGEALAYGEGINHVCFTVPDIDEETEKLVKKGFRLVLDFKRNGVRLEDYLDTREFGNIFVSLRTLQTEEMKKRKAGYAIVDWKFYGHSAVVKDIDKTVKYYQSMNIAEIQPQAVFDSSSIADVKLYGKTPKTKITARTRKAQIGPVVYEFIKPLEGEGVYKEFLDKNGEGIIDMTFTVADLDKETAKLVAKGVPVIFSGKPGNGKAFACFDTRENSGGVMIKLMQR